MAKWRSAKTYVAEPASSTARMSSEAPTLQQYSGGALGVDGGRGFRPEPDRLGPPERRTASGIDKTRAQTQTARPQQATRWSVSSAIKGVQRAMCASRVAVVP